MLQVLQSTQLAMVALNNRNTNLLIVNAIVIILCYEMKSNSSFWDRKYLNHYIRDNMKEEIKLIISRIKFFLKSVIILFIMHQNLYYYYYFLIKEI